VLSFTQPGKQHDLPIGKLQRVVMRVGLLQVDLPEPRYLLRDKFLTPEDLKNRLAFDFPGSGSRKLQAKMNRFVLYTASLK
jgi:hypothetical protein